MEQGEQWWSDYHPSNEEGAEEYEPKVIVELYDVSEDLPF